MERPPSGVSLTNVVYLSTILILYLMDIVNGQVEHSACRSSPYHPVSFISRIEHQCLIVEKLQDDFKRDKISRDQILAEMMEKLTSIEKKLEGKKTSAVSDEASHHLKYSPALTDVPLVRDCHELIRNGITTSGVYPVKMPLGKIMNVWCDMDTGNGGWTIIQRRFDGSVEFTRRWDEYTFGFGNANSEYWIGLENMYQMAAHTNYTLRIDLWDWENNHVYAEYKNFFLASEADAFRIHVSGYDGTAGDSLSYHNDMQFSTIDKDNDNWTFSCAQRDDAGWWYNACAYSILNGRYVLNGANSNVNSDPDGIFKGIIWYHWKFDWTYSMKRVEMKLKPTLALKLERDIFRPPEINEDRVEEEQNITMTTEQNDNHSETETTTQQQQEENENLQGRVRQVH